MSPDWALETPRKYFSQTETNMFQGGSRKFFVDPYSLNENFNKQIEQFDDYSDKLFREII